MLNDNQTWEAIAPVIFGSPPALDLIEVARLVDILGLTPGAAVLDLGCGVGRHDLELVRRGFRVTAVDRVPQFLEGAKAKADREGLSIEFVCADMGKFSRPTSFDAIFSLFTSFGFSGSRKDDRAVLLNAFESLKPGGRLLLDVIGKEIIGSHLRDRNWHEIDGRVFLEESGPADNWSRLETRWIVIDPRTGVRLEHRISHNLYSATELESMFISCGYVDVRFHGDLTGVPYNHGAKRLVVVGSRRG